MTRLLLLATTAALLGGCSLISDVGDFKFEGDGPGDEDGGSKDSGGGESGSGGSGGDSGPGDGGGGTGGTGGDGGPGVDTGTPFECDRDEDGGSCTNCETSADCDGQVCVNEECVACEDDDDCDDGVCVSSACVDCRTVADCGDYELCVLNECVPDRKPSSVWFSSGGGDVSSTGYDLRVSIGAPQPMGKTSSASLKITIGPGSGFPQ